MPEVVRHPGEWALIILGVLVFLYIIVRIFVRRETVLLLYRRTLQETARERLLLSSIGFYVALAVVRVLTHMIRAGRGPFHDVSMGGRHIHHLVWGILLLLIVGYCWLVQVGTGMRRTSIIAGRVLAVLYGIGSALTLDEFALWLNLRDVYWEREGRASIDAILLFSALLAIGIFGGRFVHALTREAIRAVRGRRFVAR